MMAGYMRIKAVFIAAVIAIASTDGAVAQQVIKLDNDVCMRGLKALMGTLQAEIKTLSPPRKIAGTCRAQKLRLKVGDVELEVADMQWPSGALIALDTGEMPKALSLSLTRMQVTKAPVDDPIWGFFKAQSAGGKRMDAKFGFRYMAGDKELIIEQAIVDFKNGNIINLRARFGGVNPTIADNSTENPALSVVGVYIKRIELRLSSGRTSSNPVLAAIRDAIEADMKTKELGGQDFKRNLKSLAAQQLDPVLAAADMGDLQNLIIDAPRAKDDVLLQMSSATGFVLAQLAVIKPKDRLAAVTEAFEIKFAYGARAH